MLRPAADGPELTGRFEQRYDDGEIYDWFRYDVVRVWRQPVEAVLDCGLTVLPLAPICDVVVEQVPGVLMAISARLEQEASAEQAWTLWNATRILMGLRYEEEQVDAIIEGVTAMLFGIRGIEESSVYQGILRKGEAKGRAEGRAEEGRGGPRDGPKARPKESARPCSSRAAGNWGRPTRKSAPESRNSMTSTASGFCWSGSSTSRAGTNCSPLMTPRYNPNPQI